MSDALLFGKNIPWSRLHMWRVLHFLPFAKIADGRVEAAGPTTPHALLSVENLTLRGPMEAQVAITHTIDFQHAWSIYNERGLGADEELLVSYCAPQRFAFRLFRAILPRLMFQVFPAGHLERRLGFDREEADPIAMSLAASERPLYVLYWSAGDRE